MRNSLSPTKKLTFAAMLLALSLVMTFIAKSIPMGSFYYLRFSLTPALVIYSSLLLGPLYGAIVGMAGDLIPALLFPTGAYNFLITIVYGLLGILPWALELFTKHFRSKLRKPYFLYGTLLVIYVAIVAIFYGTDKLDASFGAASYWAKPTILAALFVLDVILCFALEKLSRYFEKRILEYSDVPSPNELAFIAVISEVLILDALKALAFYAFYTFLASDSFPLDYFFVLSMLLLGSSINIFLIVFTDSWLLISTSRYLSRKEQDE